MKTRTRIMLAGLALGAALAGGVAWATIPADTSLYTACKLKATGTIRLIDPSGPSGSLLSRCTSLETQISWSQNGQKGDPGPAGARGSDGVDGKDGLPGATGLAGVRGETGAAGQRGRRRQRRPRGNRRDRASRASKARPARKGLQRDARRRRGFAHEPRRIAVRRGPGGTQGVTKVTYTTALDSDAVSITCVHPVAEGDAPGRADLPE